LQRRIAQARFPVRKTLEHFQWSWPKTIVIERLDRDRINPCRSVRLAFTRWYASQTRRLGIANGFVVIGGSSSAGR
jgi:hypothetical protein